jgi:hypothetical protein
MFDAEGFHHHGGGQDVRSDAVTSATNPIRIDKTELIKLALDQAISSESVEDVTAGLLRLTGAYREAVADDRNAIRFINEVETLVLKQRRAWLERVRRVCEVVLRGAAMPALAATAMVSFSQVVYILYHLDAGRLAA